MGKPKRPGTHVQSCMAWLLAVVLKGQPPGSKPPVPHSLDHADYNGGSANMRLLFSTCWWIWAALTNSPELPTHRQRLLNWLAIEKQCHGHGEPLTVSHAQLHLGAWTAMALTAWRLKDAEILDAALEWLRVEFALYALCEVTRSAEDRQEKDAATLSMPWTPGGRGFLGGALAGGKPVRGKFMTAVRSGKAPGKLNQHDFSAQAVAALPEPLRKGVMKRPTEFPPMWRVFHAAGFDNGERGFHYAYFEGEPWDGQAVMSAGVDAEGNRWISREVDMERIAAYPKNPAIEIHAPQSPIPEREARRKPA